MPLPPTCNVFSTSACDIPPRAKNSSWWTKLKQFGLLRIREDPSVTPAWQTVRNLNLVSISSFGHLCSLSQPGSHQTPQTLRRWWQNSLNHTWWTLKNILEWWTLEILDILTSEVDMNWYETYLKWYETSNVTYEHMNIWTYETYETYETLPSVILARCFFSSIDISCSKAVADGWFFFDANHTRPGKEQGIHRQPSRLLGSK